MALAGEIRLAMRSLFRSPGLALSAVLTLGIAIAFNIGSAGILTSLLVRPYPYRDLDRILLVRDARPREGVHQGRPVAVADFVDLRASVPAFAAVAAWRPHPLVVTSPDADPERIEGIAASANFFATLGVTPLTGRTFAADADQPGHDRVVALSRRLWNSRFGGDASAVGRQVSLNGRSATVIGIVPDEECYPPGVDAWVPLVFTPDDLAERAAQRINATARLAPGASVADARAQLEVTAAALASTYPLTNRDRGFELLQLRREQYEFTAPMFAFVQAAAILVLLLAAINVGTLLLARTLDRRQELSVRMMLGADRFDVARLIFWELLVVTMAAIVVGRGGGTVMLQGIRASLPEGIARWVAGWSAMVVDASAVAMGVVEALAVGVIVSVAVTWTALRREKEVTANRITPRRTWGRRTLIAGEISLAAALLLGASVMVRGFNRLAAAYEPLGPAQLLRFTLTLPETRYAGATSIAAFHAALLDALSNQPDIASAALVRNEPASNVPNPISPFDIDELRAASPADRPRAGVQVVSTSGLAVLRIAVVDGRSFAPTDAARAARVAVVSREAARRFWAGRTPVGSTIRIGDDRTPVRVVGVCDDFKTNWYDPELQPTIYLADEQYPSRTAAVIVRTRADPRSLLRSVRAVVTRLDASQPISDLEPLATTIADSLSPVRVVERLLLTGAFLSALLAVVGIYGTLSQWVGGRRRELGVRYALGAQRGSIAALVLREALGTAAFGIAAGVVTAYAIVRAAGAMLLGMPSLETGAIGIVIAAAGLLTLAAALVPAIRASRVDVARLLRAE